MCWKKGLILGPLNLAKCEYLKPKVVNDDELNKDTFVNMALDHCNETKVKNLKTEDGKELKVTDTEKCSIKYINFSKYEFAKVLKEVGKDIDKPKKQKSNQTADLEKFKKQCEELGFKPKTEKFGECVLRLLEASN